MPPKGRKDPSLLTGPDGDIEIGPSTEELEADSMGGDVPQEHLVDKTLIYDGEIAGSSMTLAVVLPGDSKESYFRGHFTGRRQPQETDEEFSGRIVTVTRELTLGQLDDAIDALAQYQQDLAASGRLGQ
jgi:hypothetical protein